MDGWRQINRKVLLNGYLMSHWWCYVSTQDKKGLETLVYSIYVAAFLELLSILDISRLRASVNKLSIVSQCRARCAVPPSDIRHVFISSHKLLLRRVSVKSLSDWSLTLEQLLSVALQRIHSAVWKVAHHWTCEVRKCRTDCTQLLS